MDSQNLKELFENRIFRIPDFQRGYAWGERQLNDLWDDIIDIQKDELTGDFFKHYTGTIFIEQIPLERIPENERWLKGVKFYDVVDGQQRLTTIALLLFELISKNDDDYCGESMADISKTFIARVNSTGSSKVYKFGYQGKQNYFLLNSIFEDASIVPPFEERTAYTQNLLNAKRFFKQKIALLPSKEAREEIYTKLITALQFDIRDISNDLDVQAVFETMNNRGKPLTVLEKLKNRLIYLNERIPQPAEDRLKLRTKINDAWGKIYMQLAANPNNVLDEDDFLSAHLSLYRSPYKAYTFTGEQAEVKLFEMFRNHAEQFDKNGDKSEGKEPPVSYKKIDEYVSSLADFVPLWYEVNNPTNHLMQKTCLLNGGREYKVYLCSLLKENDSELVNKVLQEIEIIMLRGRVFSGLIDERTLATRGRRLYQGIITLESELQELQQLQESNKISPDAIANGFSDLFNYVYGNKGFHRWGALKYILFEYDEFLMHEFKESSARVLYKDYGDTTIEHIIPQTYQTYWGETVDRVTNRFDNTDWEQARKVLINSLGNLTILRGGKNSELGNKPWLPFDGVEGKKTRYSTGSYNEIEISKNDEWNETKIWERGCKIMSFLCKKLGIQDLSDSQLKKALFYADDFYDKIIGIVEQKPSSSSADEAESLS